MKKEREESLESQELENLKVQNQVLQDLHNLKSQEYFRQQILSYLERIALAEERQANALEDSLESSEEDKE